MPEVDRPTPRQREHRQLVWRCVDLRKRIATVRSKIRSILSDYITTHRDPFTADGLKCLAQVKVSESDRGVENLPQPGRFGG